MEERRRRCCCCPLTVSFFLSFLRRLAKEEISYVNEAKQQEEKIERMKAEAGDEYVIKKQVRLASLAAADEDNYCYLHISCLPPPVDLSL